MLSVQGGEQVSGHRSQVGRDISGTIGDLEGRDSWYAPFTQIELKGLASLSRLMHLQETLHVPYMELDRLPIDLRRLDEPWHEH